MGPLHIIKPGALADPTLVPACHHERIVGRTRFPIHSREIIRMEVDDKKEHHRCLECGHVFKLQYLGGAEEHGHGHH